MSQKSIGLKTLQIDKGAINEHSFVELLETDADFTANVDEFREDTIELGFIDEAHRVSKETFEKYKEGLLDSDTEAETLETALKDIIDNTANFIGQSYYYNYGEYNLQIVETDFSYIVALAYVTQT